MGSRAGVSRARAGTPRLRSSSRDPSRAPHAREPTRGRLRFGASRRRPFDADDAQRERGAMMQDVPNQKFERVFSAREKAALKGEAFVSREFVGVDFTTADLRDTR